jgi:cobalt-zinc-cadmium efflux system outer membrane protein
VRWRKLIFVPLAFCWGCATPPAYEGEPLSRFLVDPVAVTMPAPLPSEVQPVPVAERPVVTLPDAVRECVLNNLRLKGGEERIRQAQADYITESLIPNSQLMTDAQLLPLSSIDTLNQAGPPQYDALVTMPIDWLVFGKRVAAQAAAALSVDVARADQADLLRKEIAQTVDLFYDALEARVAVRLAEQDVDALHALENAASKRGKDDIKFEIDVRRVRLAILDAQRELRKRRGFVETSLARLQVRMGRPPDTPDFVVRGTLAVKATAPALTLGQAWALAEKHRPDLISARRAVTAADAAVERERTRGYPQVALTSGVDYQDQQRITGFRNSWLWTVQLTTTLPFTDRNQGKVQSAEAGARAARAGLGVATADARAEVEQAVAEYSEALAGVSGEDAASLLTARQVREGTLAAYKKGDKDLVDALDAERAYRDRVRNTLANLTDYWQALNKLNAAVGVRALSAEEAGKDTLLEEATPKEPAKP